MQTFEAWGFAAVAPPALERYAVLTRGLSDEDRRRCVRFVAPPDGELVALRADVTPQIARIVAQRRGGSLPDDVPLRLAYAADVVRHPTAAGEPAEVHQVGVELVGDAHPSADAELVALLGAALADLGLASWTIDLSHRGVVDALLDASNLGDAGRTGARDLLARKDRDGLADFLRGHGVDATLVAVLAGLCDRYGGPDALAAAREALAGTAAAGATERLAEIVAQVPAHVGEGQPPPPITVDLGEARGFDYYSGLRLRAWAPGAGVPVARGGRYDDLVGRYGRPCPATGFAIDLDALEAAMAGVAPDAAAPAHVVAVAADAPSSARTRAAELAAAARRADTAAFVVPGVDQARARTLAADAGADRLTHLSAGPRNTLVATVFVRDDAGWHEVAAPSAGQRGSAP